MSRLAIIAILAVVLAGCRGMTSEEPPVHLVRNMDNVQRFDPQEENAFFEDGAAMRPIVAGTVARGMLKENSRFYEGRTERGAYVEEIPVPVTRALLERGQERYDIYCSVCHGKAGNGQGIIMMGDYGYTPAPSYHIDRLRQAPDGYLFDVITNGVRNMPGYGHQVPVADRWAIVAYVRALQRSQHATTQDLPPSVLSRVAQEQEAGLEAAPEGAAAGTTGTSEPASAPEEVSDTTAAATPEASGDTAAVPAADTTTQETAAASEATPAVSEEPTATDEAATEPPPSAPASEVPAEETAATTPPSAAPAQATGGGGAPTGLLIGAFVGLPIVALLTLLVVAFRKKREH